MANNVQRSQSTIQGIQTYKKVIVMRSEATEQGAKAGITLTAYYPFRAVFYSMPYWQVNEGITLTKALLAQ